MNWKIKYIKSHVPIKSIILNCIDLYDPKITNYSIINLYVTIFLKKPNTLNHAIIVQRLLSGKSSMQTYETIDELIDWLKYQFVPDDYQLIEKELFNIL